MPALSLQALVPIKDASTIQPHLHKFPSQPGRFGNLVTASVQGFEEQDWYADKEVAEAEVFFAVERMRGNVSMFAESAAALEAALLRVEVDKNGSRPFAIFSSVETRFVPLITKTYERLGIRLRFSTEEIFYTLTLNPTTIAESKVKEFSPDGVSPLTVADIPLLLSYWKYAKNMANPEAYARHIIEKHPAGGIRNGNGELEAWALVHMDWNLGMLHTIDTARKRGHAKRLVAHVAKEMAAGGYTPLSYVTNDNAPSLAVFTAVGFQSDPVQVVWVIGVFM